MARTGTYPVRVLRLGTRYRVVTADLLELLGISPDPPATTTIDPDDGQAA